MASHRIEKINGQIQRELSLIIQQKSKDSRLKQGTLSITHVKATPDLKEAVVYVSILGSADEKAVVMEALERAKGFLRTNLGKILKTHSTPALIFKLDDSVDYSMHIEALLDEIKKKENHE